MPVALFAAVASALAAAGVYLHKRQTKQRLEERLIERLDSIAPRDAIVAPDQRLIVVSGKVDGLHRAD